MTTVYIDASSKDGIGQFKKVGSVYILYSPGTVVGELEGLNHQLISRKIT